MADTKAPPLARRLRVPLFGLAGLLLTPIVTYLLGWMLYGRRDTWAVGQGEGFIAFLMGVYATPFGAAYWALVAALDKAFPRGGSLRVLLPIVVFVAGLAIAVVVAMGMVG